MKVSLFKINYKKKLFHDTKMFLDVPYIYIYIYFFFYYYAPKTF